MTFSLGTLSYQANGDQGGIFLKGELRILNNHGHTAVEWDTEQKDGPLDPAYAKAEFDRLVRDGYLAVGETVGGQKEQLRVFDPDYPEITISLPLVGG